MDQLSLYLFAIVCLALAGTVKGVVGLGLPTTSLGLMTQVMDARTAVGLVLVPMLVSNLWQLYRAGEVLRAIRQYAPYVVVLVVGLSISFALSRNAPNRLLLGVLGLIILIYVALTLTAWAPRISARADRRAQVVAGGVSGAMGGLVGIWAPPLALYLAARGTTKDEFVRASGLVLFVGSVPLLIGYLGAGLLRPDLIFLSIALLVPTFIGFSIGERLRGKLSEGGFRAALMIFFAVVGLNLLRKAFF